MAGRSCREAGHIQASPERRPATSLPTVAFAPARGILFARLEKVEDRMSLGKMWCPLQDTTCVWRRNSIMADQRGFGNADKSPAEGGTQVRDRSQEGGTQGRDRAQEAGAQGRDRDQ